MLCISNGYPNNAAVNPHSFFLCLIDLVTINAFADVKKFEFVKKPND